MSDRIFCCIDGCRRSWKDDSRGTEIICGRHYKMASSTIRNRFKRVKAAIRREQRRWPASGAPSRLERLISLEQTLWSRIKSAAEGGHKPAGIDAALAEIGVL